MRSLKLFAKLLEKLQERKILDLNLLDSLNYQRILMQLILLEKWSKVSHPNY